MDTKVWEVLDRKGWNVHTIRPEVTVFEAIQKMDDLGIGALVVTNEQELDGIITERDYLQKIALRGRSSSQTQVGTIMTEDVVCVGPNRTVHDCMTVMSEVRCRHLPVMRGGRLAGIISMGDCARQLTLDRETEIQYLRDFITSKYPG